MQPKSGGHSGSIASRVIESNRLSDKNTRMNGPDTVGSLYYRPAQPSHPPYPVITELWGTKPTINQSLSYGTYLKSPSGSSIGPSLFGGMKSWYFSFQGAPPPERFVTRICVFWVMPAVCFGAPPLIPGEPQRILSLAVGPAGCCPLLDRGVDDPYESRPEPVRPDSMSTASGPSDPDSSGESRNADISRRCIRRLVSRYPDVVELWSSWPLLLLLYVAVV